MTDIELRLTEGEADILLPAAVDAAVSYARGILESGGKPDADDYDTLYKFQVIAKKVQRAIGMPDQVFLEMLARGFGTPQEGVQELLIEAQRQCGGRK